MTSVARPLTRNVSPTPGIDEQQPDVRVGEDVAQRVGDPVARPVGDQQRALVEDADEAGRIAARRHVAAPSGADVARQMNGERSTNWRVRSFSWSADLRDDELLRAADQLAKLRLVVMPEIVATV